MFRMRTRAEPGAAAAEPVRPRAPAPSRGNAAAAASLDAKRSAITAGPEGTDGVEIHADEAAARVAAGAGARALTVGRAVYFGKGQYRPGTAEGDKLLKHELGHVAARHGGVVAGAEAAGPEVEAQAEHGGGDDPRGVSVGNRLLRQVDPELDAQARAGAAALRAAMEGRGTDEQAIFRVLNQRAEVVLAVRARYERTYGADLVAELGAELDDGFSGPGDWEQVALLLRRAGIEPPARSGGSADFATPQARSGFRIVARPASASALVGTPRTYALHQPDALSAPGSRDDYRWSILPDPTAVAAGAAPGRVEGPTTPTFDHTWSTPGRHVVVCVIQHRSGVTRGEPVAVELEEDVRTPAQATAMAFAGATPFDYLRYRVGLALQEDASRDGATVGPATGTPRIESTGPNPAVPGVAPNYAHNQYRLVPSGRGQRQRWYARCDDWSTKPRESYYGYQRTTVDGQPAFDLGTGTSATWIIAERGGYDICCDELDAEGRVVATARYRQVVQSAEEVERTRALQAYTQGVDQAVAGLDRARRVGLRVAYVNEESGASMSLAMMAGAVADGTGTVRLLDLTPGASRTTYTGTTLTEAIDAFDRGNDYPRGRIELEVPANEAGLAPTRRSFVTNGTTPWDRWSQRAGWASLGLAALGVAALAIPGAQVAAPYFFLAATGTGAAASALSIADQLAQGEASATRLTVDVLGLASSVLGGTAAFRTIRAAQTVMARGTRMLIWSSVALDGASGALLSVEGYQEILAVLDGPLPEGEKAAVIARILARLAVNAGLILYNVRAAWIPQGISETAWRQGSRALRSGTGDIGGELVVQGSRASGRATAASDIDFAILVDGPTFDALVRRKWPAPNPGSANERQMLHAIETGKIQAGELGLRGLRRQLEAILGVEVDLSAIRRGGPFDRPPYLSLPTDP